MGSAVRMFWAEESGATAIEYALIASFISFAVVSAATSIGQELITIFQNAELGFKNIN